MPISQPFDPDLSREDLERVLASPPFAALDTGLFPAHSSLAHILTLHARVRHYRHGALIVRKGDYGSSAFVVLSGRARVILSPSLPAALLGHQEPRRHSLWRTLVRFWQQREANEVRARHDLEQAGARVSGSGARAQVVIADLHAILARHETEAMEPGDMFGEIAALSRNPRRATVIAEATDLDTGDKHATELVEIRWQGLRQIRRLAPLFRQRIDSLFRGRNLIHQLRALPLFATLDQAALETVAAAAQIESHGNEAWYEDNIPLEDEPVVCAPGQPADALWLIQGGFARIIGDGPVPGSTLGFLRPGELFGLEELVASWRAGATVSRPRGLRALGTLDLLRIPLQVMRECVFERVPAQLLPAPTPAPVDARMHDNRLLDFLVDHRYLNGRAAMLVDLNRCTRCDDCVHACASVHGGNPRFVRDGHRAGPYLVAQACMHCVDPVCLVDCPTGAIHRNPLGGQVLISEQTCIGCGTCASSCPYGNIRMVEIQLRDATESADHAPVLKATSCDLCRDRRAGPACQAACPYDALLRVDVSDSKTILEWMK